MRARATERVRRTIPAASAKGDLVVEIHSPAEARGQALALHGRNGAPAQAQLAMMIEALLDAGIAVLAPHLAHSADGEGPGSPERFTMAGHLADAAAVLARADALFGTAARPLLLAGHSMGAYAAVRLAAEARRRVAAVLAVSPVISGAALLETRRQTGPGALARLAEELPGAAEEWPDHDLASIAPRLSCPAAVIVGADDTVTPPEHAARLAGWLPRCVHYEVLPGEHHCPVGAGYARSLAAALSRIAPG